MEISLGIILGTFYFIFGTLIGSFLNVVILRHNTGKNLRGRSRCQSCGRTLTSLDLIPVLSFLFQRGVCRVCKSKISIQYPIVEFLTGVLFLITLSIYSSVFEIVFSLVIVSISMMIAVYDFRHGIIPNAFVYTFIGISFFSLFFNTSTLSIVIPSWQAFLAGPLLALPVWFLWQISSGKWIGLGDAKLFLAIGWLLGMSLGITAFAFAFWIGAVVSLALIFLNSILGKFMRSTSLIRKLNLKGKDLTIKAEIPFAPFVVLGFLIVYFFEYNLISLIAP